MSAALRKLHKASKHKVSNNVSMQLGQLAKQGDSELAQLALQTGLQALQEIKKPLTPILSWFDEAEVINITRQHQSESPMRTAASHTTKSPDTAQRIPINTASNTNTLARLPLKSPPCKRCPALSGGLCKCALKRL